ncbi:MAG: Clp protease N-terminal domain-containing protein [Mycobacteriales bacterium]
MFERFTKRARTVVGLAVEESVAGGHGRLGPEHLLLGLLTEDGGVGGQLLREHGLRAEAVRTDPRLRAGRFDAERLASLGIDLDEVRRRTEEAFGPGALDRRRPAIGSRRAAGAAPFTAEAKRVLELSLREAVDLHHRYIGTEHLLLALVQADVAPVAALLAEHGVTHTGIRAKVLAKLGRRADCGA